MAHPCGPSFGFANGGPRRTHPFAGANDEPFPFASHPLFSLLSDLPNITSNPNHPLSQFLSQYGIRLSPTGTSNDDEEGFEPAADVFDTKEAYLIHVELPGASKEDVGISYDAATDVLEISGVIYRKGDEEVQKGLITKERKVGLFTKKVTLAGDKAKVRVNSEKITARLEGGVLEVVVPKEEWEEVGDRKRVVIE